MLAICVDKFISKKQIEILYIFIVLKWLIYEIGITLKQLRLKPPSTIECRFIYLCQLF